MDNQNPYRAPEAPVVNSDRDTDLAELGERLAAALIDTFIMLCIMLPAMFFGGYFKAVMDAALIGAKPPFGLMAMWGGIGFLVLVLVQGYPLSATAQTWGKRILKIRIVDLDGSKPPLARLLAMRYLPVQIASLIPFIGSILPLVDVLFIFRNDRRCVHDLIAGTRVVKAR
jgi:uncharacterized RDD family membrane protein YckC